MFNFSVSKKGYNYGTIHSDERRIENKSQTQYKGTGINTHFHFQTNYTVHTLCVLISKMLEY